MQTPDSPPRIEVQLADEESHPRDEMHPYEAVDPFTASISLQIRNNQRRTTISSVDDIGPPRPAPTRLTQKNPLSTRGSKETIRTVSEQEAARSARCSFESNKSEGVASSPHVGGEALDYNSRGRPVEYHPFTPRRRNAIAPTSSVPNLQSGGVPVEYGNQVGPNEYIPQVQQQGYHESHLHSYGRTATPSPANSRSTSPVSVRNRLGIDGAPYVNFSEAFLPVQTDLRLEKVTSPNVYNSPTMKTEEIPLRLYILIFLTSILPSQIYLHCLLRLPYMYFSRVDQIFVDAHLTLEEIKEMALKDSIDGHHGRRYKMPKAYSRLKKNWEDFIDNLMREWKTLNIISGLLLSGILTIFQIDGANADPITRYAALCSLNCALLSLLYGCFFIIRFGGMRRVYKAAEWALEAQNDQTVIWNVWVMLALPAIWLVWSILGYVACIMAFMWRVRANHPLPHVGPHLDFGLRIFVCFVFGIGIIYAILIINTLRRYGSNMDKAWKRRIEGFRSSQPRKCSQDDDEPQTPNGSRFPRVAVVPPTPPASHGTRSHMSAVFIPSRPTAQIPLSLSRRSESPASSKDSASLAGSIRTIPLILSESLHASPEQMGAMDLQPTAAMIDVQFSPAENHASELGLVGTPKILAERLPLPQHSPHVQPNSLPRSPELQRSSLETVPEVSELPRTPEPETNVNRLVEPKRMRGTI